MTGSTFSRLTYWLLDRDGNPVKTTQDEWIASGTDMFDHPLRFVGQATTTEGKYVSSVFIGDITHEQNTAMFETAVFEGGVVVERMQAQTRKEAQELHAMMVAKHGGAVETPTTGVGGHANV